MTTTTTTTPTASEMPCAMQLWLQKNGFVEDAPGLWLYESDEACYVSKKDDYYYVTVAKTPPGSIGFSVQTSVPVYEGELEAIAVAKSTVKAWLYQR